MSSPAPGSLPEDLLAFVSNVEAWRPDGSTAQASTLRVEAARLARSPVPRELSERSRGVARVLAAYRSRSTPDPAALLVPGAEALAAAFAPFLGDPAMLDGAWPFERPLELSDRAATDWLRLLAPASPVDDRLLRLARIMFLARRREAWTPASETLAALALRSPAAADFVRGEWQRCHRDRPARWRATLGEGRPKAAGDKPDAHALRHAFHLGCCVLACGGDPELLGGATVDELLAAGLPTGDASDASAVLSGWVELARVPRHRERVAASLHAILPLRRSDAQCEEVLRALVDALRPCPEASTSIEVAQRWLLSPARWRASAGAEQVDGLESWLRNLTWARAHEAPAAMIDEALSDAGAAEAIACEAAGAPAAPMDAGARASSLLALLAKLELFETTEPELRAVAVATLVRLVRDDARVRELPWPSLLRRAGVPEAECAALLGDRTGTGSVVLRTAVAGPPAIAKLAAERFHSPPALVIRDQELPASIVLALVSGGSAYLETQLAVQLERLLREAPSGADRAKLLWSLLRCDPTAKLFEKLHQILRGLPGEPTPLRVAVAAARALTECPPAEVAVSFRRLLETLASLCESDAAAEPWKAMLLGFAPLEALAGERPRADAYMSLGTHLRALEQLSEAIAVPAVQRQELGRSPEVSPLHDAWRAVELQRSQAMQGTAGQEDQERLVAALLTMQAMTRAAPRVERRPIEATIDTSLAEATSRLDAALRIRKLLDDGDEDAVLLALFGAPGRSEPPSSLITELPAALVQRTGRFLLKQSNFLAARRLARANRQAPGPLPKLTVFAAGVLAGVTQLLDVGTVWTELLERGDPLRVLPICLGALTLTAGVLAGEVWNKLRFAGDSRSRVWRVLRRSAVLFGGGAVISTLVTGGVLLSIDGTSLRPASMESPFALQLALWSSLSLFLGVVVARVMEHGSSKRDEDD